MEANNTVLDDLSNAIDLAITESDKELLSQLESVKVDVTEELNPPQIAWQMVDQKNDEVSIIGTLGNFSLVIGKAKSRKSFFINIVVSSVISENLILEQFQGCLPTKKKRVLYFDTEQGKYHVQLALKRICKQIGIDEPKNLDVYGLRSKDPKERLQLIEYAIENTPEVGFVVIDGIKDLVTSINDEEQATMIASKLLKWTEEKNVHIVTVLHQNKSDNNARGHIGTELINKAETVLSVTKAEGDPDISIVEPQQCRNKEPKPFAFEILNGLPVFAENHEIRTSTRKNTFDVTEMENFKIYQLLTEVYSKGDLFSYSELTTQIRLAYKNQFGKKIGTNRTKDLITIAKNNKWLLQEKPKAPYTLGKFDTESGIEF